MTDEAQTSDKKVPTASQSVQDFLKAESGEEDFSFPLDELQAADLKLPTDYVTDIMAAEVLDHLTNHYRARAALRAARNSGDSQQAERLFKLLSFSRLAVAIIQHEYPEAKGVADEIAQYRALTASNQRKALLQTE